ncbi:MAG TPA: hypothetical protein VFS33_10165 [Gemmatimonadales bacterium]|nr:hypothetical protein [Gemmatimonadales bacterium]
MRPSSLRLAALLLLGTPAAAYAGPNRSPDASNLLCALHQFVMRQIALGGHAEPGSHVAPQSIPPADSGGPSVNLDDLSHPAAVQQQIRAAAPTVSPGLRLTVQNGQARLGDYTVGSAETVTGHLLVLDGNANVYGRVLGNLVTMDGDVLVHPGGVVSGDILALHGNVKDAGGEIGGEVRALSGPATPTARAAASAQPALTAFERTVRNAAGVLGVFVTLLTLGGGLVLFARPNLEVVADTVSHSFGRSFVTGLLGQILLLPTFGMLVVGLVLSVAGILLLPFAVVVYALLVILGVVGGYVAVAHAVGETYTRRQLARGSEIGSPNSYRYLFAGLIGLFLLWAVWAVFGWVPVAGNLIRGAAVLVTWLVATAGFGAALLSRAGIRENFAGRLIPPEALTDEYLWATPQFGVPSVRRPEGSQRSGGRQGHIDR